MQPVVAEGKGERVPSRHLAEQSPRLGWVPHRESTTPTGIKSQRPNPRNHPANHPGARHLHFYEQTSLAVL